jgi:hypothetical protein
MSGDASSFIDKVFIVTVDGEGSVRGSMRCSLELDVLFGS